MTPQVCFNDNFIFYDFDSYLEYLGADHLLSLIKLNL